ncbi:hypothetical protein LZL87_013342 [Fusarium oxysporum]|nr:hypothetical protein LZL87_013342 [Fusarium oxysporum]
MARDPLNFPRWLAANSDRLQPPVSNFCLYDGKDFILQVVGGPNTRNDFHVNSTEEWFCQIKGSMLLLLIEDNQIRHVTIREGEMFLVDLRTADTVGLVMEMVRPWPSLDCLRWYCTKGNHSEPTLIHSESFYVSNLVKQLIDPIERWRRDEKRRTCPKCGKVEDPQYYNSHNIREM